MPERLLTTAEVAELYGVTDQTVRNYADAGRLRAFKLPSGHRRYRLSDVEAAMEEVVPETTDEDPASEPAPSELRSA